MEKTHEVSSSLNIMAHACWMAGSSKSTFSSASLLGHLPPEPPPEAEEEDGPAWVDVVLAAAPVAYDSRSPPANVTDFFILSLGLLTKNLVKNFSPIAWFVLPSGFESMKAHFTAE